ncbi:MAG: arsenate reductase ArsC [Candidatus Omnitrophica bacterium]|nr:arsenate reductase ArsC [Candidatus Omnitrophota bacterium]
MEPKRILFVCVENACRSQIAEAFARRYGGARVMACSAGSRPRGQVDAGAIAVMKERGIDLGRQASKGLSDLPGVTWDAIVTMGCGDACPTVPAKQRVEWQIPDPAHQPVEIYRQVRDVIDGAVKALLERLGVPSG